MPRPRYPLELRHPPIHLSRDEKVAFYEREIWRLSQIYDIAADTQYTRNQHIHQTTGSRRNREDLHRQMLDHKQEISALQGRAEYEIYKLESQDSEEGGAGIRDTLSSIFHGGRRQAPPEVRKILAENNGAKIVSAQVGIQPLSLPLKGFLHLASNGEFEKKRRELGYNDINHSYMILTLDNGKTYRLEKYHVINMEKYNASADKNEKIDLKLSGQPELGTFLDNAEKHQELTRVSGKRGNFWHYDPQNNNCQYFIDDLVQGNPDVENKREANSFFFQPSTELYNTLGRWKTHIGYIGTVGSIAHRLLYGESIRHRRCAHRYRPY